MPPKIMPARGWSLMSRPRRCRPKRRMSAPAMGVSALRCCLRKTPTALADAPKEMKTTEKPAMKESEEPNKLELGTSPLRSCSTPTPESMEM